jgi:hypothetical protein
MHVFIYREPLMEEAVNPEAPAAALPGEPGPGFQREEVPAATPEQPPAEAAVYEEREPVQPPPEEAPAKKKTPAGTKILLFLLLLVIAGGVFSILQPERARSLYERAVSTIRRVLPFAQEKTVFFTAVEERFVNSSSAGNLMVIRGMAVNNTAEPLPPIRVRARILDPQGKTVREEISLGGNILTDEELTSLSLDELKSILATPGGRDYPNTLVPREGTVPFMILVPDPPANAVEYTIDTVPGS